MERIDEAYITFKSNLEFIGKPFFTHHPVPKRRYWKEFGIGWLWFYIGIAGPWGEI